LLNKPKNIEYPELALYARGPLVSSYLRGGNDFDLRLLTPKIVTHQNLNYLKRNKSVNIKNFKKIRDLTAYVKRWTTFVALVIIFASTCIKCNRKLHTARTEQFLSAYSRFNPSCLLNLYHLLT
jgi:hypothetical protein